MRCHGNICDNLEDNMKGADLYAGKLPCGRRTSLMGFTTGLKEYICAKCQNIPTKPDTDFQRFVLFWQHAEDNTYDLILRNLYKIFPKLGKTEDDDESGKRMDPTRAHRYKLIQQDHQKVI